MTDKPVKTMEEAATAWERRVERLRLHTDLIPLMDEEALAAYLGLSPLTVREWRRRKTGPAWFAIRSGNNRVGNVRYSWDDVSIWLQTFKVVPPPPDPKQNPVMYKRMIDAEEQRIKLLEQDMSKGIPAHLVWRKEEIAKRRASIREATARSAPKEARARQSVDIAGAENPSEK